jgi:predicted nucleic acid-binding protein
VARNVVVDAGPIVASLHLADERHEWAVEQFGFLRPPALTCEPALAEAAHLVLRGGGDPENVIGLVAKGVLRIGISVQEQAPQLRSLMRRYRDIPMSLTDACLVRMSELFEDVVVMTCDSDFRIYRRHRRLAIPLLAPEGI